MNLVPIDTGGTATDLVGGDPFVGGDFAALMSGLMTGDTQIVPHLDIPTSEHLPDGTETSDGDEAADLAGSILEFIGTPPSGSAISPQRIEAAPRPASALSTNPEEPIEPIAPGRPADIGAAETVSIAPAPDPIAASPEAVAAVAPGDRPALATVHPISNAAADASSSKPPVATPVAGAVDGSRSVDQPSTGSTVWAKPALEAAAPPQTSDRPAAAAEASTGAEPLRSAPFITADTFSTAAQQRPTESIKTLGSEPEPPAPDVAVIQSDVEVETGNTARQVESARPGVTISQPALIGVARRVEEAIAALATKPDPKIVTLQLDELDGLRLTVALRADGIHLSSSGDAALTTEIERALATRGFEMASGNDGEGQRSDQEADNGWRPQPTPPGRMRTTNSSDIRL